MILVWEPPWLNQFTKTPLRAKLIEGRRMRITAAILAPTLRRETMVVFGGEQIR